MPFAQSDTTGPALVNAGPKKNAGLILENKNKINVKV